MSALLTSKVLLNFLSRLIMDVERKVLLILDNHRVQHSKIVPKWHESPKDTIELFYLSLRASESNPVEYLNGDEKERTRSGLQAAMPK